MSSGRPPTQRCRELVEELPADDVLLPPVAIFSVVVYGNKRSTISSYRYFKKSTINLKLRLNKKV